MTSVTFVGCDVSPQAIALCRSRANDKLHFELGDATIISGRFFDMILVDRHITVEMEAESLARVLMYEQKEHPGMGISDVRGRDGLLPE
jgi:hypothetical protein